MWVAWSKSWIKLSLRAFEHRFVVYSWIRGVVISVPLINGGEKPLENPLAKNLAIQPDLPFVAKAAFSNANPNPQEMVISNWDRHDPTHNVRGLALRQMHMLKKQERANVWHHVTCMQTSNTRPLASKHGQVAWL